MEENKLFDQFKSAAENAGPKDFPGMETIWQRVEGKLDKKKATKTIQLWKKIAVAACLLLFSMLGYEFFNTNVNTTQTDAITTNDSIKKNDKQAVAGNNPETKELNPAIKKDAGKILQQQLKPASQVVMEESLPTGIGSVSTAAGDAAPLMNNMYSTAPTPEEASKGYIDSELRTEPKGEVELFMSKSAKAAPRNKEQPLVLIDDKIVKNAKLENIEFTEADSLVVLKEPLYIINGEEFTEQQVFGPNPTSPYTPLNKQEIETISILQHEKAVEAYGKKGEKGVVIITTKTGKPSTIKFSSKEKK